MIEREIILLGIEDPGSEELDATRTRLRGLFAKGATRRMTQLGLLMGSVLEPMRASGADTVVYASKYGESRALRDYLASFPSASPTLFQTSIHPSAVQQVLVARQQPVREFLPLAGDAQIVAHAAQAALLAPAPSVVFCGGEECIAWSDNDKASSPAAFAFALLLSNGGARGLGTLRLEACDDGAGDLALPAFFAALRGRRPLDQIAAPGMRLILEWR